MLIVVHINYPESTSQRTSAYRIKKELGSERKCCVEMKKNHA